VSSFEDCFRPLTADGQLEKPHGVERLKRSEAAHAEDVDRLHIDESGRVFAELERLIIEIGGDTDWPELEPVIRAAVVDELGRELRTEEEQRLLETWITLAPGRDDVTMIDYEPVDDRRDGEGVSLLLP